MSFLGNWKAAHEAKHAELTAKYGSNYDKPSPKGVFGLNVAEQAAVDEWTASLRAEIMAIQNKGSKRSPFKDIMGSEPYYGATGGGLTYAFTPTSLGTICVVTEAITKKSLNVAEATDWFFYG
jgi:hypothetical protein